VPATELEHLFLILRFMALYKSAFDF